MAQRRQRCPGCLQEFSSNAAMRSHVTQSRNPVCQITYNALIEANLAHDQDFAMHSDHAEDDLDIIGEPNNGSVFSGDFFGADYQANDFPGLHDNDEMELEFTANADIDDDVSVNSDIAGLDYSESDDEDYFQGNNIDLYEEADHEPMNLKYIYFFIIKSHFNIDTPPM